MWDPTAKVISVVIGIFGAESLLTKYLALIVVMTRKGDSMQQTVALRSALILRKVMFIPV